MWLNLSGIKHSILSRRCCRIQHDGRCVTRHAGAIGSVAADKYEPSKYRDGMNLQFGMVAARPSDMFLLASDGLWDTLDPVQVLARPPVEFSAAKGKLPAASSMPHSGCSSRKRLTYCPGTMCFLVA